MAKHLEPLEREVADLATLHHAHLIHYLAMTHKIGEDAITIFVLSEYCGGGTLAARLAHSALPLAEVRTHAAALLSALLCLHDHGIVHGDVRPGSVFFDSQMRVRLGNYSVHAKMEGVLAALHRAVRGRQRNAKSNDEADAQLAAAHRTSMESITSPQHAGPLQISRERDIQAFGYLVLEMALGQTQMAGLKLHDNGQPIVPANLEHSCRQFVLQCLEIEAQEGGGVAADSGIHSATSRRSVQAMSKALLESPFLVAPESMQVAPDLRAFQPQPPTGVPPENDVFLGRTPVVNVPGGALGPHTTALATQAQADAAAANNPYSRYRHDFEELEVGRGGEGVRGGGLVLIRLPLQYLGAGGFGAVVKARNRLDTKIYAIKVGSFGKSLKYCV